MSDLLANASELIDTLAGFQKCLYDFITVLREPTPVKITHVVHSDDLGCIGGGLDSPDPHTLYECPMSQEAWLHRIFIMSPNYPPYSPLTDGEMLCFGSTAHEVIFYLPERFTDQVVPSQCIQEGSRSSPHLNSGERVLVVGDQLPPNTPFIFHFQIVLVSGISGYTPRQFSPTRVRREVFDGYQPGTTLAEP